jgi:hypothetical protein
MNPKSTIASLLLTTALAVNAQSIFSGNGNSGFGGPIGGGSLSLADNGTVLSGTFTKGPNGFNDVLVIYIDSVTGGFANTSSFGDGADGLRKSISGFDGGANRSTLTFASGFLPDFALALGPSSDSFGGLWSLASGGANSLSFVSSANLTPTGTPTSSIYTFSINLSSIGITTGQSFGLFGTYTSNSGYRSDEGVLGSATGSQGWNNFTQNTFATYTVAAVPEPSSVFLGLSGAATFLLLRRRNK